MKKIMQMSNWKLICALIFFFPHIIFCQYPVLVDSLIVQEQSTESSIIVTSDSGDSKQYHFQNGKNLHLIVYSWLEHDFDSISNDWKFEFNIDSLSIIDDSIVLTHSVNDFIIFSRKYSLKSTLDTLGNRVVTLTDDLNNVQPREKYTFSSTTDGLLTEKRTAYSDRLRGYYVSEWQRIDRGDTRYFLGLNTYYFGTKINSRRNRIHSIVTLDWVFHESIEDYETAILRFEERKNHKFWANEYELIRLYGNEEWFPPKRKKVIKLYKKKNGLIKNGRQRIRI